MSKYLNLYLNIGTWMNLATYSKKKNLGTPYTTSATIDHPRRPH